jgi:serralysin
LNFSPLDIAALQYIYGPSRTARAGNDIYKVSSSGPNFIWDGAGTDTIDLSNVNQGATVFLTPGYWGFVGSQQAATITFSGQITVNFGSIIENLTGSAFADKLYGNDADNHIVGGLGNDWLEGWDGNDVLIGGLGDDQLNGGLGIDIAQFEGSYDNYVTSISQSAFVVTDKLSNAEGIDVLISVERLKFLDKSVAIDLEGHAGKAVKVIGAVLGKDGVKNPGLVGIGLSYLDNDLSYSDLGLLALNAVGATTNDAIVSKLWFNLVGSAGSALDKAPYINMLADGMKPGDLVVMAANLPLNTYNIGLVGLMQTGVEFAIG